jgi:hypothetical protein
MYCSDNNQLNTICTCQWRSICTAAVRGSGVAYALLHHRLVSGVADAPLPVRLVQQYIHVLVCFEAQERWSHSRCYATEALGFEAESISGIADALLHHCLISGVADA